MEMKEKEVFSNGATLYSLETIHFLSQVAMLSSSWKQDKVVPLASFTNKWKVLYGFLHGATLFSITIVQKSSYILVIFTVFRHIISRENRYEVAPYIPNVFTLKALSFEMKKVSVLNRF